HELGVGFVGARGCRWRRSRGGRRRGGGRGLESSRRARRAALGHGARACGRADRGGGGFLVHGRGGFVGGRRGRDRSRRGGFGTCDALTHALETRLGEAMAGLQFEDVEVGFERRRVFSARRSAFGF